MKKIKSKYLKALAILLSMAMLMTGLPAPIYAESVATPTDTAEVLETTVEETVEQPSEIPLDTPEQAEEPPTLPEEPEQPVEMPEEETAETVEPPVETPAEDEPVIEPDEPDIPEQPEQSDISSEEAPEEPVQEDVPADESDPTEEPADDLNDGSEEPPVVEDEPVTEDEPEQELPVEQHPEDEVLIEDEPSEPILEDEPIEEPVMEEHPVKAAIATNGYAYLLTDHSIQAFSTADMWEHCFTIEPDGVLLVTAFVEQDDQNILEVQFLMPSGDLMLAYVYADDLPGMLLTGADIDAAALTTNFALVFVGDGKVAVFAVDGMAPGELIEDQPVEDVPVTEQPNVPDEPDQPEIPSEELPAEQAELELPEQPEGTEQPPEDDLIPEVIPPVEDEPDTEIPVEEITPASEGTFVLVTTDTRAFLEVDDSAADDYEGDLNMGVFVHDAAVQVESVEQDSLGRIWYRVRYMYGDTPADGTLKWTDYDSIYVLAEET